MRRALPILAAIALAGCGGPPPLAVTGSSPGTVLIEAGADEADQAILSIATAECSKQGSPAAILRYRSRRTNPGVWLPWYVYNFECRA